MCGTQIDRDVPYLMLMPMRLLALFAAVVDCLHLMITTSAATLRCGLAALAATVHFGNGDKWVL